MESSKQQCIGCGSTLQSDDSDAPGYVPKAVVDMEQPLCRRCFRIRNYGEFSRVVVAPETYGAEVSRIRDEPGLILYVLDVFDLSGSLVQNLVRYIAGSRVIVVVNKTDVLPPEVKPESLAQWVRSTVEGTGINPYAVVFVSAARNHGLDALVTMLDVAPETILYAVGMANVGKSTLLNQLLHSLGAKQAFTASRVPGTTLAAVGVDALLPTGRMVQFVDTPGLIHGHRITDTLCPDCLRAAVPADKIKPRGFQLDPGQTLWLGGFARFDFEAGVHQPIVCYASNGLTIHRSKTARADEIYAHRADDVLPVPCPDCRVRFEDKRLYPIVAGRLQAGKRAANQFTIGSAGADVVLAGLGWISLQGTDFRGRLWAPMGIGISRRPKLIGGLTETATSTSGLRRRTGRPFRRV